MPTLALFETNSWQNLSQGGCASYESSGPGCRTLFWKSLSRILAYASSFGCWFEKLTFGRAQKARTSTLSRSGPRQDCPTRTSPEVRESIAYRLLCRCLST